MAIKYVILLTVLCMLVIIIKNTLTVIKASKRINLLYDYFILNQKELPSKLSKSTDRPDPNDGSGCPTEEELKGDGS